MKETGCGISEAAHIAGVSRSTLLYYERIGLVAASRRTASSYRQYNEADMRRLERIALYKKVGLPLGQIKQLLDGAPGGDDARVIEARLEAIEEDIRELRNQERLLVAMFQNVRPGRKRQPLNKTMWMDLLRAAGLDEKGMRRWHMEFEKRAPGLHRDFLVSLGLDDKEIECIRAFDSGKAGKKTRGRT